MYKGYKYLQHIKKRYFQLYMYTNKLSSSSKLKSAITWNLIKVQRVPDDFMFHENENYRASHIL